MNESNFLTSSWDGEKKKTIRQLLQAKLTGIANTLSGLLDSVTGRVSTSKATRVVLNNMLGQSPGGEGAAYNPTTKLITHYPASGTSVSETPSTAVIYCNATNNKLYRWDDVIEEMVEVSQDADVSSQLSGKADLLSCTTMLTPAQWPMVVLVDIDPGTPDETDYHVGDIYLDGTNLYLVLEGNATKNLGEPRHGTIYECNGKLYTWNGSAFVQTNKVPTSVGELSGGSNLVHQEDISDLSSQFVALNEAGKLPMAYLPAMVLNRKDEAFPNASAFTDGLVCYYNKKIRYYYENAAHAHTSIEYDPSERHLYYYNGQLYKYDSTNGMVAATTITLDDNPTASSANAVKSGGVYAKLALKQDVLVAGDNITIGEDGKTISANVEGATVKSITSILKTDTAGLVDTYTITFSDNTTTTFTVTNGAKGDAGDTIVGEMGQGTLTQATTKLSQDISDDPSDGKFKDVTFEWLLVDSYNNETIVKPIWHVVDATVNSGNGYFVDALGAIIS